MRLRTISIAAAAFTLSGASVADAGVFDALKMMANNKPPATPFDPRTAPPASADVFYIYPTTFFSKTLWNPSITDPTMGAVYVSRLDKDYTTKAIPFGNLHNIDYNIFYMDIRANAVARVAAFTR